MFASVDARRPARLPGQSGEYAMVRVLLGGSGDGEHNFCLAILKSFDVSRVGVLVVYTPLAV